MRAYPLNLFCVAGEHSNGRSLNNNLQRHNGVRVDITTLFLEMSLSYLNQTRTYGKEVLRKISIYFLQVNYLRNSGRKFSSSLKFPKL